MKKIAVIYWSQTGNTAQMAEAVAAGAKEAGADVHLTEVSGISAQEAAAYDALALGCPAMGAEVLEEAEFEPFFTELEPHLQGKPLLLFGSYGWGDGQWMRDWQERCEKAGAALVGSQGVMVCGAPCAEETAQCKTLGAALAQ